MRRKYLRLLRLLLAENAAFDVQGLLGEAALRVALDEDRSFETIIDDLLTLSSITISSLTQPSHQLTLRTMTGEQCRKMCRFEIADVEQLIPLLGLPEWIIAPNGTRSHIFEAFPLFLNRMAKNHDFYDMERDFGRKETEMRLIFNEVLRNIWRRWHTLLSGDNICCRREMLRRSARAISAKLGLPFEVVLGFIDGKLFETARPKYGQEAIYNGKDRVHGLKYQAIVLACGLLANFAGPFAGRRHDAFMWSDSNFMAVLDRELQGLVLALFGDAAYPRSDRMLKPFIGVNLTAMQHAYNDRWCSGTTAFAAFVGV
jgi:hypothetical protein